MILQTQRDLIKSIVNRYEDFISQFKNYHHLNSRLKKLKELDLETAKPEDITKILDYDGWIIPVCSNCHRCCEAVVIFGNEDYKLCVDCADKAFSLLNG